MWEVGGVVVERDGEVFPGKAIPVFCGQHGMHTDERNKFSTEAHSLSRVAEKHLSQQRERIQLHLWELEPWQHLGQLCPVTVRPLSVSLVTELHLREIPDSGVSQFRVVFILVLFQKLLWWVGPGCSH